MEPDWEQAYVKAEKITEFLLNPNNSYDPDRAKWFISRGYTFETLQQHLLLIPRFNPVTEVRPRPPYGTNYSMTGEVQAPNGDTIRILTAWQVPTDGGPPCFITAHPN